jgi:hypothetical protein
VTEKPASVTPQEVLDGFTHVVLGGWVEQAVESLRHAHNDDPDLVPLALVEQVEAIVVAYKDRLWPLIERLHDAADAAPKPEGGEPCDPQWVIRNHPSYDECSDQWCRSHRRWYPACQGFEDERGRPLDPSAKSEPCAWCDGYEDAHAATCPSLDKPDGGAS